MINLAFRDILHSWGRFAFTGVGLGLLIGTTLTMAGVFRGMVDDARVLIDNSGTDLWVVQQGTLGPYAEPSTVRDDAWRAIAGISGVAEVGNAAYLTIQLEHRGRESRAMIVGIDVDRPGRPGTPGHLVAGRPILQGHYEAVADERTGLLIGEKVRLRRHKYTVVGLTRRMVSSSGDPMIFVALRDAQEIQFLKDNDALAGERQRTAENPAFNRPGVPGLLEAVQGLSAQSRNVNAVLVRLAPHADSEAVAGEIQRWKRLTAYTRAQMEDILVAKLIATSARQIGMFLVILALVTAAIIAFIIYTMTMAKVREIAVLKLVGAKNRSIVWMILQQALGLGIAGFVLGRLAAGLWGPAFPKYVLLLPVDAVTGLLLVVVISAAASVIAIRAALRIDPAEAIGG